MAPSRIMGYTLVEGDSFEHFDGSEHTAPPKMAHFEGLGSGSRSRADLKAASCERVWCAPTHRWLHTCRFTRRNTRRSIHNACKCQPAVLVCSDQELQTKQPVYASSAAEALRGGMTRNIHQFRGSGPEHGQQAKLQHAYARLSLCRARANGRTERKAPHQFQSRWEFLTWLEEARPATVSDGLWQPTAAAIGASGHAARAVLSAAVHVKSTRLGSPALPYTYKHLHTHAYQRRTVEFHVHSRPRPQLCRLPTRHLHAYAPVYAKAVPILGISMDASTDAPLGQRGWAAGQRLTARHPEAASVWGRQGLVDAKAALLVVAPTSSPQMSLLLLLGTRMLLQAHFFFGRSRLAACVQQKGVGADRSALSLGVPSYSRESCFLRLAASVI
ncbi:unnamed protein product [Rangifer tarandus platyrhynchus]|uniref:Uncharacterized protein n=1 Tax=Rangifer tarandus platyrhynchus TaxID=3082113 RepID=A0ABN8XNJ3_RANTA|nr:unnamed protein product [Rangifer tarandus platyrhynchus]